MIVAIRCAVLAARERGLPEVRPVTWWLQELLTGRLGMDEVPPSIASWSRFFFWQAADEIVALENVDERRKKLAAIPERVRPYVEAEVMRLWGLKKSQASDAHTTAPRRT